MKLRTYYDSMPPGGRSTLAESLKVSLPYLYQIATHRRPVPPTLCHHIETATKGAVTVHDLRPDVFGPAPGIPPALPEPAKAQDRAA